MRAPHSRWTRPPRRFSPGAGELMGHRHGQRHAALSRYVDLVGGPDAFAEDLVASTSAEFRRQLIELVSK